MREHRVLTPEQVELNYHLVEMPTRVAATFVDAILQLLMMVAVLLLDLAIVDFFPWWYDQYYGWMIGMSLLVTMVIFYVYSVYFEFKRHGQTPGKKLFGIRVIRVNGEPASMSHVAIRNAFKYIFDMLGIGIWMMLFNKQCRRLGDLVGGTLVVYTTQRDFERPEAEWVHRGLMHDHYDATTVALMETYRKRRVSFVSDLEDNRVLEALSELMLKQQDESLVKDHVALIALQDNKK